MPLEQVSPELVLVDPELAERERARLCEKARLEELLAVADLRRAVMHDLRTVGEEQEDEERDDEDLPATTVAARFLRKRVLPAALLCSLVVNGYFAADLVVRRDSNAAAPVPLAAYPSLSSASVSGPTLSSGVAASRRTFASAPSRRAARKTVVERKLVSLVLSAPSRKLPRAFVDPKTGLVRNNVQIACRSAQRRSYLCTIGLARTPTKREFVVRYRTARDGSDVFRWYGYSRIK